MPDDEMARAHDSDTRDHARMQGLARTIAAFIADPPARARPDTLDVLGRAGEALEQQCAHIVAVWN